LRDLAGLRWLDAGESVILMKSTVRTPRRHRFDVVEGSGRIYVQSMFGQSGTRLSSAATITRYWSP
jgi:hypothetical protein